MSIQAIDNKEGDFQMEIIETNVGEGTTKEKSSKSEKYIDLVKWFFGSVLLVILTIIIDKGFRERSAGIQEMQAFDKYVEIILKADNIEERWKLSEFFSTVTPTDRLREKWIDYKKLITEDYSTFKQLKEKEATLKEEMKEGKSIDAVNELNKIKKQLEPFERKLIDPSILKSDKETTLENASDVSNNYNTLGNKQAQISNIKDPESNLAAFKDEFKKVAITDIRYKIDDIFNKSRDINNEVVQNLGKELGDLYQTIQTGAGAYYKESTYSNQYGIQSKFDATKSICPIFTVKVTDNIVVVTMQDRGSIETFKTPTNNIEWEKMKIFIRTFFLTRLDQLK